MHCAQTQEYDREARLVLAPCLASLASFCFLLRRPLALWRPQTTSLPPYVNNFHVPAVQARPRLFLARRERGDIDSLSVSSPLGRISSTLQQIRLQRNASDLGLGCCGQ